ncbi:3300_t:CDS:2, partial [Funneliformis mosseae]
MALKSNLKDLKEIIKDLEKADEDNQFTLNFLRDEIGSDDLDNLKELLGGRKLTEILAELSDRKQDVIILNNHLITKEKELLKLNSQLKYLEEKVKEREEAINVLEERNKEIEVKTNEIIKIVDNQTTTKKETIKYLEEKFREHEKEVKMMQEIIIELGEIDSEDLIVLYLQGSITYGTYGLHL